MSAILACRLLESKALPRGEVAQALRESCTRGIALVQALMERVPDAAMILEYEFLRWTGPRQTVISTDVQLVGKLPLGMCERLLALPSVRASEDAPVPLAVVDPFDVHAMAEFRYCLGLAVTPVRVSYDVFVRVLDEIRHLDRTPSQGLMDPGEEHTPAFGVRAIQVNRRVRRTRGFDQNANGDHQRFTLPPLEVPRESSERPIALVRTTLAPPALAQEPSERPLPLVRPSLAPPALAQEPSERPLPLVRPSLAPPAVSRAHPSLASPAVPRAHPSLASPAVPRLRPSSVPTGDSNEPSERLGRDSEPVLTLVKQKVQNRPRSIPAPAHPPPSVSESPNLILSGLEEAESAARLLELLRTSLASTAPCQVHFSLVKEHFVLKWSTSGLKSTEVALTEEQEGILRSACQSGYFLGPLPADGDGPGLGYLLGMQPFEEVYVAPVTVKQRAVLVVVVGRFDDAFAITRWVDALALRSGQVLERLLLRAKNQL